LKSFFLSQILLSVFGTIALWLFLDEQRALSYGAGSLMMLINVGFLVWTWSRVFQKKQIALAVSLVVFKYALLGVFIYWFLGKSFAQPLWMALGFASILVSALIAAISNNK
jgi:hypothetical protein